MNGMVTMTHLRLKNGKNNKTNMTEELQVVSRDPIAEGQNADLLKWIEAYLWDNDKKGYQAYYAHRKSTWS